MERTVLVIKTARLFELVPYFQGFSACKSEIIGLLEENSVWLNKKQAEEDPTFKQLIGYCAIIGPDKKIFTYRRAVKDAQYEEKRLQGKWSIGIGGHVEPLDSAEKGFVAASISREINEEIRVEGGIITNIKLFGTINDDSNSVGQVHFGLLMTARVSSSLVKPKDPEIAFGESKTIEEIHSLFQIEKESVENWSLIAISHIHP